MAEVKFPTIQEMAEKVAEEAMKNLTVNDVSLGEFLQKIDNVAGFLKCEMVICEKRLEEERSTYYDGVDVGFSNAQELTVKHMLFCKRLLDMMN